MRRSGSRPRAACRSLTQPRIARAAGVRQSHLTYYFPTVAELLQAVARHMIDALVAEVRAKAPSRRPAALVDVFARVATEPRRVRVMLALVTAADREPALKPGLRRLVRELRSGIAAALASAGIAAGPDDVAFMHAAVVGGAVLASRPDQRRGAARGARRARAGRRGHRRGGLSDAAQADPQ